ncbi:MAG: Ig-like domain-containing protein, partial [Acidobacteriota bacterium]
TLSLAQYDNDRDEWRVVTSVATIGTDRRAAFDVSTSGNYALVYADKAAALAHPPVARAAAALQGVANPCAASPAVCRLTSRRFTLDPTSVLPNGRTTATLVTEGAVTSYPSGTAVQAYIDQQLNLVDGRVLVDPPFATDLLVYRGLAGDTAAAVFHLAPTSQAAALTLRDGVDHIRVVDYPGRIDRGSLIGSEGGRIPGDDSVSIDLPAGATTEALHASVTPLRPDEVSAYSIAGFHVAGGFTLSLSRATDTAVPEGTLPRAIELLKPARGTFTVGAAANAQIIVAEVLSSTPFGTMYRLAALTSGGASSTAGVVVVTTKSIDAAQFPVDGIVRDGRYLILTADNPIAFTWGQVRSGTGGPAIPAARITAGTGVPQSAALGIADLTRTAGTFALPVPAKPASTFSLVARAQLAGDSAASPGPKNPDADEIVPFGTLVFVAQPLHLLSVSPADGTLLNVTDAFLPTATFDQAVDPNSGAGGIIINNTTSNRRLAGTITVAGNTVQFHPTEPLAPGSSYAIIVGPTIRAANGAPFGISVTSHITTRAVTTNASIRPELIHITIPDANGRSTIFGPADALPAGAQAVAVRHDRFFLTQYQATVQNATPFSFEIGTAGGADGVTMNDTIDLHVIDAVSRATIAVIPLTPFVTPDLTGFIASPDHETVFTTPAGISIAVPAGAFDTPTLVQLTPSTRDVYSGVPRLDEQVDYKASIHVDFAGEAKKRLQVTFPLPSGASPTASYYLASLGQSIRGPRLVLIDTLRYVDGKVTTTLDPASQSAPQLRATSMATPGRVQPLGQVLTGQDAKVRLMGIVRSSDMMAFAFVQPMAWLIVPGSASSAQTEFYLDTLYGFFFPQLYNTERGEILVPVPANHKFTITGVNSATGLRQYSHDYDAVTTPGDPSVAVNVPAPNSENFGPYPVFASPARVAALDVSGQDIVDGSVRNLSVVFDGKSAKFSSSSARLDPKTHVEVLNVNTGGRQFTDDFAPKVPAGSPPPSPAPVAMQIAASEGDRLIVLIGGNDVDPNSALTVTFNEPVYLKDDDYYRTHFKLSVADKPDPKDPTAVPKFSDISTLVQYSSDSGQRRVILKMSALAQGKIYRVTLSNDIGDTLGLGGASDLHLGEVRKGPALATPLNLDFSTRAPAGPVAQFNIYDGGVRDLAMSGNMLFVSALQAGLLVYDASDPGSLGKAGNLPIAQVLAPPGGLNADGSTSPGENWAVTAGTDGRVYTTALSGTFGMLRTYRVEDFISPKNPGGLPVPTVSHHGSSIICWRPGVNIGLPISTETTISDRPEALPRRLQLVTKDDSEPLGPNLKFDDLTKKYGGGGTTIGEYKKVTLTIPGPSPSDYPYMTQRVTVRNEDLNLSWSTDIRRGGSGALTVLGRPNDHVKLVRNLVTYGVVTLFGYGIGIFDINAIDANRIGPQDEAGNPNPLWDPTYQKVKESVVVSPAPVNPPCDPDAPQGSIFTALPPPCQPGKLLLFPTADGITHCPIKDLRLAPDATIMATDDQIVTYALDMYRGLLEFRVTPAHIDPATSELKEPICKRPSSLVLVDKFRDEQKTPAPTVLFNTPRLNTLRHQYKKITGRDPWARFTAITTVKLARKVPAPPGSAPGTSSTTVMKTYGLIAAQEYGLLVVRLDPDNPLTDMNLVDVIWVPAGVGAVRVIDGRTPLATVLDTKGRVLLVDLTNIDEADKVSDPKDVPKCFDPDCEWTLFPTVKGALVNNPAVTGEVGFDDPRIIWKSPDRVPDPA